MSRKRKYNYRGSPDYSAGGDTEGREPSTSFSISMPSFIQAHEATITRNRPDLVQALTTRDSGDGKGKGGLIQWNGEESSRKQEVWVDRYDACLLLTSLPSTSGSTGPSVSASPSPTGWSDLPSDSEDTFFFSPAEIEEFQRKKRRKLIDEGREARLRAMRESDADYARGFTDARELWGDDDEEPDDVQRTLMERTAKHLLTSPNSGQLEMRILANHGSDQRFAFLRGRWRNAWQTIKLIAKEKKVGSECKEAEVTAAPGGLVAYGDSDTSDAEAEDPGERSQDPIEPIQTEAVSLKEVDELEKEARRARAREWIRQRKAKKIGDSEV